MRLWNRTASPWDASRLPAAEAEALRESARRRLGEDSFGETRAGLRVEAARAGRRGLFEWLSGAPRERTQYLLLFERYLLIIEGAGPKSPAAALACPLDQLEIRDPPPSPYDDRGFEVFGLQTHAHAPGSIFVGLGDGPESARFEGAVRAAVDAARS